MNAKAERIFCNRDLFSKERKDGSKSKLSLSARADYPRFTLFKNLDKTVTGIENMIIIPFTPDALDIFLEGCDEFIKSAKPGEEYAPETGFEQDSLNNDYKDNVRTDDIVYVGTIKIGINEDKTFYFSVTSKDNPEFRFLLSPDDRYFRYKKDGSDVTKKFLLSKLKAKIIVRAYKEFAKFLYIKKLKEANGHKKPEVNSNDII